jgi:acetolactate synthase I/II/III large subunit
MKLRVSDFIVKSLESVGIDTTFTLTGGFAMHLNDSFGRSPVFSNYYHHHEQACGFAALGYSKAKNKPCVVSTTAGVGATNAISPCLDAFQDNVSILFLTGQVKTFETIRDINSKTGYKLRNYAFSDCDIISMVSSITKFSHEIMSVDEVPTVMANAISALFSGRNGPVWLSVPLDVQGSLIDVSKLPIFSIPKNISILENQTIFSDLSALISSSKRPIVLAGNGIKLAGCKENFLNFIESNRIPVVTSHLGVDLIESASPFFVGRVGLYADRSGNFAIQNADLVISLGCRLSQAVVGYNPHTFAREAKIVAVDIDSSELEKKTVPLALKICCDLNCFFDTFKTQPPDYSSWVEKCGHWKAKWLFEVPPNALETSVINPYHAVKVLFDKLPAGKIVTAAAGTIAIIVTQMINIKKDDIYVLPANQYDMGPDLPMSIGSHVARPEMPLFIFTGEGTFQFNIQELQTIVHHKFPLKIIVFNNSTYGAIEISQQTFFKAKFGVDKGSGISFPDTEKIAGAYGISYVCVSANENLPSAISDMILAPGPVIFEIFCCLQSRFPKLSAKKNEDGTFTSLPYEDMEPFLPRDEFRQEMLVKPLAASLY